jgi:hypothetical protein
MKEYLNYTFAISVPKERAKRARLATLLCWEKRYGAIESGSALAYLRDTAAYSAAEKAVKRMGVDPESIPTVNAFKPITEPGA